VSPGPVSEMIRPAGQMVGRDVSPGPVSGMIRPAGQTPSDRSCRRVYLRPDSCLIGLIDLTPRGEFAVGLSKHGGTSMFKATKTQIA
jgi:hypothetical protein